MVEVKITAASAANVPQELKQRNQWVCWVWQDKPNGDKTKVPVTLDSISASTTNPKTWTSFDKALEHVLRGYAAGVGYVFVADDDYIGIDLDDCTDADTGVTRHPESGWVNTLNSYSEYSPSGTGIKVIIKGKLPEGTKHGFGQGNGIYESGRFFTITGHDIGETRQTIREVPAAELQAMLDVWFPAQQKVSQWSESAESLTDTEVLRLLHNAKNSQKFISLYQHGDISDYASQSEADTALISLIAFYTGPCPNQIHRIFSDSALWRDKWTESRGGETYGERTIEWVLDHTEEYYGGGTAAMGVGVRFSAEHNPDSDSAAAVVSGVAPVVPLEAWKQPAIGYPTFAADERPYALRLLVEHVSSLASGFKQDWSDVSALGFISSLFPHVMFENLPLGLWTLGVSLQATGKSLVGDEMNTITHSIAQRMGLGLAKYGSGSTAGMIRRLEGNNRAMLAYFSEWAGLMAEMERDHSKTMRETLLNLYDGRDHVHQLAQESIVVNQPRLVISGVTTIEGWKGSGSVAGINDGFYSRLMFVAPDVLDGYTPDFKATTPAMRTRLVNQLGDHFAELPAFTNAAFESGELPAVLRQYMLKIGMLKEGEPQWVNLEDASTRSNRNEMPGGRSVVRVKKVATLLALCEQHPNIRRGTLWVSDEHIALAIRLVQRCNAYAKRVFAFLATSQDEYDAKAVVKALRNQGSSTMMETMAGALLGRVACREALQLLQEDGIVGSSIENGVRRYWLQED